MKAPGSFKIAGELKVQPRQVAATAKLFAEGATVPFIARYRKEATGSLDEVAITSIRERLLSLAELDQRREAILKSLAERNLLTEELKGAITKAETLTALEDIYQPYRPKRRTRATIAKEQGLEPLADILFNKQSHRGSQRRGAGLCLIAEKGVADVAAALAGARDILAERISDDAQARDEAARVVFEPGGREIKGDFWKGGGGREVQGLLRRGANRWQNPQPPAAGHAPWRKRGLADDAHPPAGGRGIGGNRTAVCHRQRPGRRAGAPRGAGQLQAFARPGD